MIKGNFWICMFEQLAFPFLLAFHLFCCHLLDSNYAFHCEQETTQTQETEKTN